MKIIQYYRYSILFIRTNREDYTIRVLRSARARACRRARGAAAAYSRPCATSAGSRSACPRCGRTRTPRGPECPSKLSNTNLGEISQSHPSLDALAVEPDPLFFPADLVPVRPRRAAAHGPARGAADAAGRLELVLAPGVSTRLGQD